MPVKSSNAWRGEGTRHTVIGGSLGTALVFVSHHVKEPWGPILLYASSYPPALIRIVWPRCWAGLRALGGFLSKERAEWKEKGKRKEMADVMQIPNLPDSLYQKYGEELLSSLRNSRQSDDSQLNPARVQRPKFKNKVPSKASSEASGGMSQPRQPSEPGNSRNRLRD